MYEQNGDFKAFCIYFGLLFLREKPPTHVRTHFSTQQKINTLWPKIEFGRVHSLGALYYSV